MVGILAAIMDQEGNLRLGALRVAKLTEENCFFDNTMEPSSQGVLSRFFFIIIF